MKGKVILVILAIACFCQVSLAQSAPERMLGEQTTGFSYQGSLKSAGAPANGNHDFEFRLWDAASGGAQIGSTVVVNGVAVTNGIFAVTLDFGNQYPDTSRFLEVRVRPTGGGAFTALSPREQIRAVPYAVKSLNTEQLGGVPANQYITNANGAASFIHNTTTLQASSNFNIGGDGTAAGTLSGNVVNAGNQFNIGGNRVLGIAGTENLFAGVGAGTGNTIGTRNSYFGFQAGSLGLGGNANSYFGWRAGRNNNSDNNSFFGHSAGILTSNGASNTFIGSSAGGSNTSGSGNTFLGNSASALGSDFTNATAIGNRAFAGASNTIVLGGINGVNGCNPVNFCDTVKVGIGTIAPQQSLHVNGSDEILSTGSGAGFKFRKRGSTSPNDDWVWFASDNDNTARFFKIGTGNLLTIQPSGEFAVNVLGSAGTVGLCRNASNQISTCSSSLKYKTNIAQYSQGLAFVNKLKPISYDWKDGGMRDVGFGAEDVAKIDPRFITYNSKGEVEGVKYDRLSVAFVNAFKEQQAQISGQGSVISGQQRRIDALNSQIENQKTQIEQQQKQLDALMKLVCAQNPTADVCKEEK